MLSRWWGIGWREAGALLWGQSSSLAAVFVLVSLNRISALAVPVVSKTIVDDVIGARRSELLTPALLIAAGAIAVEATTAFSALRLSEATAQRAIAGVRRELHRRVTGLPLTAIESHATGALVARLMAAPDHLHLLVGAGMTQLMTSVLTALLALTILFSLHAGLTVLLVGLLLSYGALVLLAFSRLFPAFYATTTRAADLTGWLTDALGATRVTKVCVAERQQVLAFARQSHGLLRALIKVTRGTAAFSGASTLAVRVLAALVVAVGAQAVTAGTMSLGELVMYGLVASLMIAPVVQVAALATEGGKALAALRQIAEIKALTTETEEDKRRKPVTSLSGQFVFENVGFLYEPGQWVLRGVTMQVEAGCTIALVGPSGSGKSTICRLILALDQPTSGRILVDRQDLSSLRRQDYRRYLNAVFQDDMLFNDTVANNVRYGKPRATIAEVLATSHRLHCDEFVSLLPMGYDTVVGERGVKLSGGQRQRIALARALIANPPILVLDEATSQLDAESELMVHDALRALRKGRTTFVVTHRLSAITRADHIVLLESGQIIEQGRHESLMSLEGRYWQLYQAQLTRAPNRVVDVMRGDAP